jgi:hypothetical protein
MSEQVVKCQCGSLKGHLSGEPTNVIVCHCRECQRRTGSAFSYNVYYERERARFLGPASKYERLGQDGRKVRQFFCPTCGTTVYWELDLRPHLYGIAATLLESPPFLAPVWEIRKCNWVVAPAEATHFETRLG